MWTSFRYVVGVAAVVMLGTAIQAQQVGKKNLDPPRQPAAAPPSQQPSAVPTQRTVNKPVTSEHSPADIDRMIAGMLALSNEEEATLGRFAAEHSKHEQVQKFADMMAKDHSDMAKQLQKWSPQATLAGAQAAQDSKRDTAGTRDSAAFDPIEVHKQIATRCIASAKKDLGEKKGSDFDMAYVGSQCVLHQQMIDKASVLRQYASPDLQSAIDKGVDAAQSHLDHAKQLIEKLAQDERRDNR